MKIAHIFKAVTWTEGQSADVKDFKKSLNGNALSEVNRISKIQGGRVL